MIENKLNEKKNQTETTSENFQEGHKKVFRC